MTKLPRAIVLMLVFLAVFFNIERLDYGDQSIIDLQTFVYVLVTIQILSTLFIRFLQRLSPYLALPLWLGVYLVLKVTVFNARPVIGGYFTYVTITEILMVVMATYLSTNLASSLYELEGMVSRTVFPKRSRRVKDLSDAEEDIRTEFVRSRRHNHPLAVMVIEIDQFAFKKYVSQNVIDIHPLMMNRFVLASLGQVLTKVVRRTDMILEPDEQNGFILICPETRAEGARLLAERILAAVQKELGLSVLYGIAVFPDESVTFEELVKKAHNHLGKPEEPAAAGEYPIEGRGQPIPR